LGNARGSKDQASQCGDTTQHENPSSCTWHIDSLGLKISKAALPDDSRTVTDVSVFMLSPKDKCGSTRIPEQANGFPDLPANPAVRFWRAALWRDRPASDAAFLCDAQHSGIPFVENCCVARTGGIGPTRPSQATGRCGRYRGRPTVRALRLDVSVSVLERAEEVIKLVVGQYRVRPYQGTPAVHSVLLQLQSPAIISGCSSLTA
jgi:hypothetical protein